MLITDLRLLRGRIQRSAQLLLVCVSPGGMNGNCRAASPRSAGTVSARPGEAFGEGREYLANNSGFESLAFCFPNRRAVQ